MTRRRLGATSGVLAAALLAVVLAGCASQPTSDRDITVLTLQERVYTVSAQIADGETEDAAETLEDLEELVRFSSARGTLGTAEAEEIRASIEELRSALR